MNSLNKSPVKSLEVFFDFSSPWTYLAFKRLETLIKSHSIEVSWRPILVGAVFNAVNDSVYKLREAQTSPKFDYLKKDLRDWIAFQGAPFAWPKIFPINSAKALRGVFIAEQYGVTLPYIAEVFSAYWRDGADIGSEEALFEIWTRILPEENADKLRSALHSDDSKKALRENIDELIKRGGFGTPTFYVGESDMYFGNDRLHFVERALIDRPLDGRRDERAGKFIS